MSNLGTATGVVTSSPFPVPFFVFLLGFELATRVPLLIAALPSLAQSHILQQLTHTLGRCRPAMTASGDQQRRLRTCDQ